MQRKRLILTLASGLAGLACLTSLSAQTAVMPVDEIRAGMVGIGRTVFEGTRVEEFRAHILGVAENVIGTKRSLILARLEGGPLANTGVIAGMSGSPVYIDGRLIGAVAYSLGSFSKEAIAGITPIGEMTTEAQVPAIRPVGARVRVEFPATPETLIAAFRKALNWNRPFADRAGDVRLVGVSDSAGFGSAVGTMLRPIATPLVMSGFEPDVADLLSGAFRDQGFLQTGAGAVGAHGEMPYEGPLKPGDAVGVLFVNGDLQLGGTGTVTHIDGDHVYAFGHPMYNIGPTEFPMTRAYVYTLLPSLYSSSKLSTTGEVIGTFLQDRPTAISGRLGAGPPMIPVTLHLESERVPSRTFRFSVVKDQMFTPLMTFSALINTLLSYERQYGTATYSVRGKALVKGHDPVSFDNVFAGNDSPSSSASAYVIAPITALMSNDREKVDIEAIDLTFTSTEEPKTATLERVWLDDPRPAPGRTVPVKILLRTYRGDDVLRTIPIRLPANATGNLSVMVTDGSRLTQMELRETRAQQLPTVAQLVRTLNRVRRNSTLYVRLLASDSGAVVNGEVLSALPPSVLAVVEADRDSGSVNALSSVTLGEWELPTDYAVSGARTLTISMPPN